MIVGRICRCRAYVPTGRACPSCGAPPGWCPDCNGVCRPEHRRKLERAAAEYERAVVGVKLVP